MERHEILEAMTELKLYGMRASFDEIAGKGCDFAQRDAIERAVHSLAGCGLLHRSEALVLPSRAALRFDDLLGE